MGIQNKHSVTVFKKKIIAYCIEDELEENKLKIISSGQEEDL